MLLPQGLCTYGFLSPNTLSQIPTPSLIKCVGSSLVTLFKTVTPTPSTPSSTTQLNFFPRNTSPSDIH